MESSGITGQGWKIEIVFILPNGQRDQARSGAQGDASSRPPLGIINVNFAAPGRTGSHPSRVMFVS